MIPENAVKMFVQVVWEKGSKDGWPVNAGDIDLFGSDPEVARRSLRNVVTECENRGYLKATLEGDIADISKAAKVYIGVVNSDEDV